jgi:hypothetical protein
MCRKSENIYVKSLIMFGELGNSSTHTPHIYTQPRVSSYKQSVSLQ